MRKPVTIGSITGAFLGILPGVGGPIAAVISYDYAKKASKQPEQLRFRWLWFKRMRCVADHTRHTRLGG